MLIALTIASAFFLLMWVIENNRCKIENNRCKDERHRVRHWKTLYEIEKNARESIERDRDYLSRLNQKRYDYICELEGRLKEPSEPENAWWKEQ